MAPPDHTSSVRLLLVARRRLRLDSRAAVHPPSSVRFATAAVSSEPVTTHGRWLPRLPMRGKHTAQIALWMRTLLDSVSPRVSGEVHSAPRRDGKRPLLPGAGEGEGVGRIAGGLRVRHCVSSCPVDFKQATGSAAVAKRRGTAR
ncbi:hypothetical protein ColTof4_04289 [Colletotrichum tofieldiae]|nr:hypothetical protein ColTof3_14136 [Colletotrichum tofieldiae]GKT71866.1 hypothetical protein ColTof4_04289 [Colletotrichum tofieldiae]